MQLLLVQFVWLLFCFVLFRWVSFRFWRLSIIVLLLQLNSEYGKIVKMHVLHSHTHTDTHQSDCRFYFEILPITCFVIENGFVSFVIALFHRFVMIIVFHLVVFFFIVLCFVFGFLLNWMLLVIGLGMTIYSHRSVIRCVGVVCLNKWHTTKWPDTHISYS